MRGHDGGAVASPVSRTARCDDDFVDQSVSGPVAEPRKVVRVVAADNGPKLDLDGENAPIVALDDQIDLTRARAANRRDSTMQLCVFELCA